MVVLCFQHEYKGVYTMLAKVPWTIKTVIGIYLLRFAIGMLVVRVIYPFFFVANSFIIECTDRVIVILLVWLSLRENNLSFYHFELAAQSSLKKIIWGLGAGFLLSAISLYSERLYVAALVMNPVQHPLVSQVQAASQWLELVQPLLLAGLFAPISEEILYRLFTFLPMKDRWGRWLGAFGSAAIFALMHFNVYWLGEMVAVGVGLALLYDWSGSLISTMIAHSVINSTKILLIFLGIPFL